ncbi:MAG: DUF1501 domain-containing protein, partial [Candidatus Riflebacteria bacterium]|nr:DUF1501 domain-containing protein [Candidatus Riflebacteria bacterium]
RSVLATGPVRPASPRPAGPRGRARSVIQIWMWGGPSHLDTFDPKPDAGHDFSGPLDRPIATNVDGIRIGQLLPLLARQADRYSLIRSMTHGVNAHETASYLVQTGHAVGDGLVHPSMGAVVSLLRGVDAGYRGLVPPYVVLTTPQGRFSESGFLGEAHAPFATGGDPADKRFAVEGLVVDGITDDRRAARRRLARELDGLARDLAGDPEIVHFDECVEKAERARTEAWKVFDLSQEKGAVRDRYGQNKFGQSCLAARRLVERGVPYVTINYEGWDTHRQNFVVMERRLPEMDQAMSALLDDLADRGMLDTTIVWWGGEFGRTPRVQWEAPWSGGRHHHGQCFTALVAGGGFRGGTVVGASDARGEEVAARPVRPADLLGSICTQLGIDPTAGLPGEHGVALPIFGSSDRTPAFRMLEEIM